MNRRFLFALVPAVALAGCAKPPPAQFLTDANLAVTILGSLTDAVATFPGVDPSYVSGARTALATMQKALADLKAGTSTPTEFAKLATDVISGVAPMLLVALNANPDIRAGVAILTGLIQVIATEVEATQTTTPTSSSVRARAYGWLAEHGR